MFRKKIIHLIFILVILGGIFLFIYFILPQLIADSVYPLTYKDLIKKYALENNTDPNLVAATIWSESHFRPDAVSIAGARGLMQIMPVTAQAIANKLGEGTSFSPDKLFDPETNIRYGIWYLSFYINKYQSVPLALVAYNGGYKLADYFSATGNDYNLNPETFGYYRRVQEVKAIYDQIYGKWWEESSRPEGKAKSKKLSLPLIVLFVKHWLGL